MKHAVVSLSKIAEHDGKLLPARYIQPDKLDPNTFYPLGDRHPLQREHRSNVKAIWSGEKRKPKKDEWFLSGAIPHAYQAPNDLSTVYHIAKIVLTETIRVIRIKGE